MALRPATKMNPTERRILLILIEINFVDNFMNDANFVLKLFQLLFLERTR